jgi:hypothetical protein
MFQVQTWNIPYFEAALVEQRLNPDREWWTLERLIKAEGEVPFPQ